MSLLSFYRMLPVFKGKLRLGKKLFGKHINKERSVSFKAHQNIIYSLPNTIESLGIELMLTGIYEKKLGDFLEINVGNCDSFFDIGANIGTIGIPIAKKKANLKYFGFEASPIVFEYLKKNIEQNDIKNYKLYNRLVHSSKDLMLPFFESEQFGKSSLAPTYSQESIMVQSINLDDYCNKENISFIDWMKIDVQGFELYVFKGMEKMLLDKKVKNIVFEFEYWAEDIAELRRGAAQEYVEAMGYKLYHLSGEPLKEIMRMGRAMIWAKPL